LISQVLNLSNDKTFKVFKEKYDFALKLHEGLFGIEVRNIPNEIFGVIDQNINTKPENIFCLGNELLVTGSFKEVIESISSHLISEDLKVEIINAIQKYEKNRLVKYRIGKNVFDFKFAYVMGILNITPDSFSDGGLFINKEKVMDYAISMIDTGADIIDIGGESSRPGSEPVSELEELNRVIPVITEILKLKPDAILSIDTTKAIVAREALKNGALIVNDISGGTFEPEIFNVVSEFNAAMILMHIKGKPKTMQVSPNYSNVVSEVYDFLANQYFIASKNGIEKIFIDPGIGFGKRLEHNLTIIERLEDFKSLSFPIMVGLSRKSFIGDILNLPVEERDDATNALNSFALSKGARIIRTHNVKQAVQTCNLFNKLITN
jgi:dihydropteroate synthase